MMVSMLVSRVSRICFDYGSGECFIIIIRVVGYCYLCCSIGGMVVGFVG